MRAAPGLVDERGQGYLFETERIAADTAALRQLWFAEDRAAIAAARAAGEDDIVSLVLAQGGEKRTCLECLVSVICPTCERFGPRDSLLDWCDIVEQGLSLED